MLKFTYIPCLWLIFLGFNFKASSKHYALFHSSLVLRDRALHACLGMLHMHVKFHSLPTLCKQLLFDHAPSQWVCILMVSS